MFLNLSFSSIFLSLSPSLCVCVCVLHTQRAKKTWFKTLQLPKNDFGSIIFLILKKPTINDNTISFKILFFNTEAKSHPIHKNNIKQRWPLCSKQNRVWSIKFYSALYNAISLYFSQVWRLLCPQIALEFNFVYRC